MSDEQPARAPTIDERIAAKELAIRDEREALIRRGYAHDQKAMSGLVAATHQAYAGGGFHADAVTAVLKEMEADAAAQVSGGS